MSENLLQQLVQDVIAPDVRELKGRMNSLEKLVEIASRAMDRCFESFDQKAGARFEALIAAISESKAQQSFRICL